MSLRTLKKAAQAGDEAAKAELAALRRTAKQLKKDPAAQAERQKVNRYMKPAKHAWKKS